MRSVLPVAAVLAFAVLAGCTSDGRARGLDVDVFDGSGIIEGLVTDEERLPLEGARVTVNDLLPVITSADGRFFVGNIPAGDATLRIEADGYAQAEQRTRVLDETRQWLEFGLVRLPTNAGYREVLIESGFEACGFSVVFSAGIAPTPCPLGENTPSPTWTLGDTWSYLVAESTWRTNDEFIFTTSHHEGCLTDDPCWGMVVGPAPLRIEGAPGDEELARTYALDGKKTFPEGGFDVVVGVSYAGQYRSELNDTANQACVAVLEAFGANPDLGCPFGVGYSTGLRYDTYTSVFHNERPTDPAAYTALPDE